jgi:acetyltransferase-like isoleucine patch superfamily enzyme
MRIKIFLYFIITIEILRGFLYKVFYKILGVSIATKGILRISSQTSIKIFNKKTVLSFGKKNFIRRNCSIIMDMGILKIGDNFFMNNYSSINCFGKIEIGNDCLFGEGVRLYDHNYNYRSKQAETINKKGHQKGFIIIGNNCWLGSNTVVLMNVKIGNNVIVGANNIVFKDIPDNSIIIAKQDLSIREYANE